MSYEKLATLIKQGFDQIDERFTSVDRRFDGVEYRLANLERGQDDILLRLDQHAYRFELDDLNRRVKTIERRTGISNE